MGQKSLKYFIKTFGCAANVADSERIAAAYQSRGFQLAKNINEADHVVINTCVVRESAENRVYGLIHNLHKTSKAKIILTGCLVGIALRDKTGKMMKVLKKHLPQADEFLPIEEVGFDNTPIRGNGRQALVLISNGCDNYCSYCIVPFSRGPEISRPLEDIVEEVKNLIKEGYEEILLIGQNVNSYGADLLKSPKLPKGLRLPITYVKHLGKYRIPTLFPYLLQTLCQIKNLKKIDFMSSNPWDFSNELIKVIAENPQITRIIHLPVQSGDDQILKKMNRWYTAKQYLALISKLKSKISNLQISTDIIVGFPGETEEQFQNTVELCKKVGFYKAYISRYSPRPGTASAKM